MELSAVDLAARLVNSTLMTAEDVKKLISTGTEVPGTEPADSAQDLARKLVREKKLTTFQAKALLNGQGQSLVLGNYEILDKLGQGGMGVVLKARHRRMNRIVALKVLSPKVISSPGALERFQREVHAAARLNHPNLVTAHDADVVDGRHFLVMEFVEGRDLAPLVKEEGPVSVRKAIDLVIQAAVGLQYAHTQGIIHRDIKPANLLLDRQGQIKILDMGLARLQGADPSAADLTGTGDIMGTVDYMAPEQAVSTKDADTRSDIYSLGMTLWFLLTGRPAYQGDSLMARLLAHRDADIPSLCDARDDVPETLNAIFFRMVAKNPIDRFQSMEDVVTSLRTIPDVAAPTSRPSRESITTTSPNKTSVAVRDVTRPHAGTVADRQSAGSRAGKSKSGRAPQSAVARVRPVASSGRMTSLRGLLKKPLAIAAGLVIASLATVTFSGMFSQKSEMPAPSAGTSQSANAAPAVVAAGAAPVTEITQPVAEVGIPAEISGSSEESAPAQLDWNNLELVELRRSPDLELSWVNHLLGMQQDSLVVVSGTPRSYLVDLASMEVIFEFSGVAGSYAAANPDRTKAAILWHRYKDDSGDCIFWNLGSPPSLEHSIQRAVNKWPTCVTYSPDGKLLATSGHDGHIRVRKTADYEGVLDIDATGEIYRLQFAHDGTLFLAGPYWAYSYDATGRQLMKYQVIANTTGLALDTDEKTLIATTNDGFLRTFDRATGMRVTEVRIHPQGVNCMQLHPDGEHLFSSGADGKLCLISWRSGKTLLQHESPSQTLRNFTLLQDGRTIVAECIPQGQSRRHLAMFELRTRANQTETR